MILNDYKVTILSFQQTKKPVARTYDGCLWLPLPFPFWISVCIEAFKKRNATAEPIDHPQKENLQITSNRCSTSVCQEPWSELFTVRWLIHCLETNFCDMMSCAPIDCRTLSLLRKSTMMGPSPDFSADGLLNKCRFNLEVSMCRHSCSTAAMFIYAAIVTPSWCWTEPCPENITYESFIEVGRDVIKSRSPEGAQEVVQGVLNATMPPGSAERFRWKVTWEI